MLKLAWLMAQRAEPARLMAHIALEIPQVVLAAPDRPPGRCAPVKLDRCVANHYVVNVSRDFKVVTAIQS